MFDNFSFTITHTIKHPISQMVLGCISDQGVSGLYFVQGTVNAQVYIGMLEEKLLSTIRDHFTSVQNVHDGVYLNETNSL